MRTRGLCRSCPSRYSSAGLASSDPAGVAAALYDTRTYDGALTRAVLSRRLGREARQNLSGPEQARQSAHNWPNPFESTQNTLRNQLNLLQAK